MGREIREPRDGTIEARAPDIRRKLGADAAHAFPGASAIQQPLSASLGGCEAHNIRFQHPPMELLANNCRLALVHLANSLGQLYNRRGSARPAGRRKRGDAARNHRRGPRGLERRLWTWRLGSSTSPRARQETQCLRAPGRNERLQAAPAFRPTWTSQLRQRNRGGLSREGLAPATASPRRRGHSDVASNNDLVMSTNARVEAIARPIIRAESSRRMIAASLRHTQKTGPRRTPQSP